MRTRNKLLTQQQRQAAVTVFGEELGAIVISQAQKRIDELGQQLTALKGALADFETRLSALEAAKGYPIIGRYFKPPNDKSGGIAGFLWGSG